MKSIRLFYHNLQAVFVISALVGFVPMACAQSMAPSAVSLQGLQSVYLRAPIQRYYTRESAFDPTISSGNFQLANFSIGLNRRLYPHPDQVRAALADDQALAAFLQTPQTGPAIRLALQQATLYARLPGPGQAGFNPYNAMMGGVGNLQIGNAIQKKRAAAIVGASTESAEPTNTPATADASNSRTTNRTTVGQSGFIGDIQSVKPQAAATSREGTANPILERFRAVRQAMIRDFSALVVLSPDGRQANLYVLGRLPDAPNPDAPIDFTVVGKQYATGYTDGTSLDRAASVTLVDKQVLPSSGGSARYFLYVYPLTTPPDGAQSNLLISYWPNTSAAITHGVALVHTSTPLQDASGPASHWITIPMSRLQRYQPRRDVRHAMLASAVPGDPLNTTYRVPVRRINKKKNAGR